VIEEVWVLFFLGVEVGAGGCCGQSGWVGGERLRRRGSVCGVRDVGAGLL
jgi:hypothetical protein